MKNLVLIVCSFIFFNLFAEESVVISGIIKNSKNKKAIENVSVSVPGSNIASVTNSDGYFSLKIPSRYINNGLKVDQIGFRSLFIEKDNLIGVNLPLKIFLTPVSKILNEIVVLGGDPFEIVKAAINKIPDNYADTENIFNAFYRETIQKGNRFITISEGIADVLKKNYKKRTILGDKVALKKGRSLLSPKPSDTLAVKLAGGLYLPVMLDVVKNEDHLFNVDEIDFFEFKDEGTAIIDDLPHFIISFNPKIKKDYPLHNGKLFINKESLAFSRVEFELDLSDKNKATRAILRKKPTGLNFKPQEISGIATYKLIEGKYYLNYIKSTIKFKCDWKKRLFSSGYTVIAETVMVDRMENKNSNTKLSDTFNSRKIFSDIVNDYWEPDFWKDFNIIEPSESLEKAVSKLKGKSR